MGLKPLCPFILIVELYMRQNEEAPTIPVAHGGLIPELLATMATRLGLQLLSSPAN